MTARPPNPPPPDKPATDPLPYQSPGAHQKSQWITDDQGVAGRMLVLALMLLAVIAAVVGPIVALFGMLSGWW